MRISRLSLTTKLAAINLLLVASLVAGAAVALHMIPADRQGAELAQLIRAQRANQNADMLNRAPHADLLGAL